MTLSRKLAKSIATHDLDLDEVISTLTRYRLMALLPSIQKALGEMRVSEDKKGVLEIESPFPLGKEAILHIKHIVGTDVKERTTINKNILAGFKARYHGKLYDGSAERIIRNLISK